MNIVCFHQSTSRWGNEEPGNCTHIIPLPKKYFIYGPMWHQFQILRSQWLHFLVWFLLVISMISTVSTTHHLHHFRPTGYIDTNIIFGFWGAGDNIVTTSGLVGEQQCSSGSSEDIDGGSIPSFFGTVGHSSFGNGVQNMSHCQTNLLTISTCPSQSFS